jgi:hypothetical protein
LDFDEGVGGRAMGIVSVSGKKKWVSSIIVDHYWDLMLGTALAWISALSGLIYMRYLAYGVIE